MFFGDNKKRKRQCFCCGIQFEFDKFDEMQEHLKSEHEEGREWVKCPICSIAVRDVPTHSRVFHPNQELPKDGQLKATIWYDFSSKSKKIKTKKPNFKEGYLVSIKNNGQAMHYRSGYELEIYECLERIDEVVSYEVEPEDCVTSYFWNGKWRKYHPDLKVHFADGKVEIWECKPSAQCSSDQNRAKWDACAERCKSRDIEFKVKTEKGISKLRKRALRKDN